MSGPPVSRGWQVRWVFWIAAAGLVVAAGFDARAGNLSCAIVDASYAGFLFVLPHYDRSVLNYGYAVGRASR